MKLEAGKWYRTRGEERAFVGFFHPHQKDDHYVGYIDGKGSVYSWFEDGSYMGGSGIISQKDLVSEWTEPKFRPFRMDEVPLGAWLTMEGKAGRYLITGAKEVDLVVAGVGGISYEHARDTCKVSTDGGKTWLPCGVEE